MLTKYLTFSKLGAATFQQVESYSKKKKKLHLYNHHYNSTAPWSNTNLSIFDGSACQLSHSSYLSGSQLNLASHKVTPSCTVLDQL